MDTDLLTIIFCYVNLFYCNSMVFQFSYFVIGLKDRLNLIHDKITLKRILTNFEVDVVVDLYEKIIKILDIVNENCTTQLIPIFGYLLLNMTFSVYGVVATLSDENGASYTFIFFAFSWFIEHSGKHFCVVTDTYFQNCLF